MTKPVTAHGAVSQIEKAFLEQNPDVRKAWVHDGIRGIAVMNACTEAWALKPGWAAQSGTHVQSLSPRSSSLDLLRICEGKLCT